MAKWLKALGFIVWVVIVVLVLVGAIQTGNPWIIALSVALLAVTFGYARNKWSWSGDVSDRDEKRKHVQGNTRRKQAGHDEGVRQKKSGTVER